MKWSRKSAEQWYAKAQYILGLMYRNGEGVPQDYVQAHRWLNLAASNFLPAEKRDKAVESRDDVFAERMTPAQLSEAQQLAREWKPK